MADAAMSHLGLEEVLWIPAGRNPLKRRRPSPGSTRLEMTSLAIADEPRYSASDIEISRGGPSYTIDTLEELAMVRPYAQWWLILGSDTVRTFMDWKSAEKLARLARFAVVVRGSESAGMVRSHLPSRMHEKLDLVPMRQWDISSSKIRTDIEDGLAVEQWLSPDVSNYIEARGLYQKVTTD